MSYGLGVDLGTTFTAAASYDNGTATMVGLGNRALQIPSVLYLRPGEAPLVGEAAERRGLQDPEPLVREFKRRFGDPVPIMVGGTPYSAPALTAHLLRWVIQQTTERFGAPPTSVTLTRPANWGEFKLDLLRDVARLADVGTALTCTEPEAAAVEYASRHPVSAGEKIAIYDLGGGTFDICFFVKTADGFQMVGRPDGIEQLGGVDFDEAVFQFVIGNAGLDLDRIDPGDPDVVSAIRQLRRNCVDAKEALSQDVDTVVPVSIADIRTSVRITRPDFEALIAPALDDTVRATQRGMRSSGLAPSDISTFVLVGGSSRIPLVSEVLARAFHCTVARDTHPKHDVAMGAARVGSLPSMATELLPRAALDAGRRAAAGGVPLGAPVAGAGPAVAGGAVAAGAVAGGAGAGVTDSPVAGGPGPGSPGGGPFGAPGGPPASWPPGPGGGAPPPGPGGSRPWPDGRPAGSPSRRKAWIIAAAVVALLAAAAATVLVLNNRSGSSAAGAPLTTGASTPAASTPAASTPAASGPASPAGSAPPGTQQANTQPVSAASVSTPPPAAPVSLAVPATASWTDTGVQCTAGAVLDIAATGTIVHNTANGNSAPPDGDQRAELHKYNVKGLPDANHGALIGSIDEQQPYFVVGASRSLTCPAAGPLFLGVNDAGVSNNSGAFLVTITQAAG